MEVQLKNRTVKPNGEAIRRLRIARGWPVNEMARRVKCSVKTVENVEHGFNIYLYTLNKFAAVLGVEHTKLILGADLPPVKAPKRFKVQFTVEGDIEHFDESVQLATLLSLLKRLISAEDEIEPTDTQSGSVKITLEMSESDITRLFVAYMDGKLDDLRIMELKLPDEPDFVSELASDHGFLQVPGITIYRHLPPIQKSTEPEFYHDNTEPPKEPPPFPPLPRPKYSDLDDEESEEDSY